MIRSNPAVIRATWWRQTSQLSAIAASIISCRRGNVSQRRVQSRCRASIAAARRAAASRPGRSAMPRITASLSPISRSSTASLIAFFDSKKR